MAVARDPSEFRDDGLSPDDEPRELLGWTFTQNPARLVTEDAAAMVRVWDAWRRGGMGGGVGHLPESGGTCEQAAVMLDALAHMNAVYAQLEDEAAKRRKGKP